MRLCCVVLHGVFLSQLVKEWDRVTTECVFATGCCVANASDLSCCCAHSSTEPSSRFRLIPRWWFSLVRKLSILVVPISWHARIAKGFFRNACSWVSDALCLCSLPENSETGLPAGSSVEKKKKKFFGTFTLRTCCTRKTTRQMGWVGHKITVVQRGFTAFTHVCVQIPGATGRDGFLCLFVSLSPCSLLLAPVHGACVA